MSKLFSTVISVLELEAIFCKMTKKEEQVLEKSSNVSLKLFELKRKVRCVARKNGESVWKVAIQF